MRIGYIKLIAAVVLCTGALWAWLYAPAQAAALRINAPASVGLGQIFDVTIFLNTENQTINAVRSTIRFPVGALEALEIKKQNSVLRLWPHEPLVSKSLGIISFSGGLPHPGFTGTGELLTLRMQATAVATATLEFAHTTSVFLHDGLGTEVKPTAVRTDIVITNDAPAPAPTTTPDTTPPTHLVIDIGKDQSLYEGKYFASFTAEDSESGISHYEIAEKVLRTAQEQYSAYPESHDWVRTTSPVVLKNQTGPVLVFVKAVDEAGNKTVSSALHSSTQNRLKLRNLVTLFTAALLLLFIIARKWYRKHP